MLLAFIEIIFFSLKITLQNTCNPKNNRSDFL